MVKFMTASNVFKFNWDQVAAGLWQRYPNPNSKHVLTEDVVTRRIDGQKLVSVRILTKTNKIPKWGERFVGQNKDILIIEESVVDPKEKTITTYTRNVGLQKVMSVEEKCVYRVSTENPSWTVCEKSAWVSSALFGVGSAVEMFGLQRFRNNALKAAQGFDYILTHLYRADHLKQHPLLTSNKIKETTRKAAEIAKSKTAMFSRAT
jgi:hypothetical protein